MLTLRPSGPDDLASVVALEAATDTAEWLGTTGADWHRQAISDPDQEHLVAQSDSVVVGFAVLAGLRNGQGAIEIRRMAVHPDFRGRGHGRSLLATLIDRGYERHGGQRVWLDVKPGNRRARDLYESEGFVAVETADASGEASSELIVMVHKPTSDLSSGDK